MLRYRITLLERCVPPYVSAMCGEKLAGLQSRVKAKSDLRRAFHQRFERVAGMHVGRRRNAGRHKPMKPGEQ